MSGQPSTRAAIVIAVVAFVIVNAVFYFLSGSYFDAHRGEYSPQRMTDVRVTFAFASAVVTVVSVLAGLHRRIGPHMLATVLGLGTIVSGIATLVTGMPVVLATSQLVAGALMPILAWHSYRGARAPWAFLVAICGTFAVVALFGAPRIGTILSVNLWTTMIIPGLYVVGMVRLIQLRGDYVERDIAPA
jgi:hypothetical protein